jgi:hypothetical protein
MKQLLLAAILLASLTATAQKDLPAFGNVTKADLELTECPFDKEAMAYRLVDEGKVAFEWDNGKNFFRMTKMRRIRIKIFKDKALNYADVRLRYVSDDRFEKISDISAATYNLGAGGEVEKTKLEKSQIFNQKVSDNLSEVKFTFPGAKAGSVIEYRYTITTNTYNRIDPWYFQGQLPVQISNFELEVPEYFKFTTSVNTYTTPEKKEEEFNDRIQTSDGSINMNVGRYRYTMRNIAPVKIEPFMSSVKDYIQRVEFQLNAIIIGSSFTNFTSDWEKLAQELRDSDNFGVQLRKNVNIGPLDAAVKAAATPYEKMTTVHRYFRKNYRWDGVEDYLSINAKKVADNGSGSSGDINLLMINKLKDAGLEVYPVLVSTRDNGRVNIYYPFMRQFNNVLAMVVIDGKRFFLNGIDQYNPSKLIPYDVMTTDVLVVKKDKTEWITLWDDKMVEKHRVTLVATLNEQGVMEGEAFLSSFDYAKNPRVKSYTDDKDRYQASYLKNSEADIKINELKVENLENDTLPMEQKFKYTYKLNTAGEYAYFSLNLFTGLEKNPFLAEKRVTDIDFGYNRQYSITGHITIPENYQFEELPKVPGIIMPDTSIVFMRHLFKEDNTLSYKITLDFKRPSYYAAEYDDFREFYKQLFAMLNEQLVLKKIK